MTKICYRVETCFCGMFVLNYRTKCFDTSVHVYFVLHVMRVFIYLQQGCSHNAMLKLLKYSF